MPLAAFEEAIEVAEVLNNIAGDDDIERAFEIEAFRIPRDYIETPGLQGSHTLFMQVKPDDAFCYRRNGLVHPKTASIGLRIVLHTADIEHVFVFAIFNDKRNFMIAKSDAVGKVAGIGRQMCAFQYSWRSLCFHVYLSRQ